jgi:hypothetical protein
MTNANPPPAPWTALLLVLALGSAAPALAQGSSATTGGVTAVIETKPSAETPAPAPGAATGAAAAPAPAVAAPPGLAQLAWLEGCWRGVANDREFLEHWLPLRGDLLVGVSHTVMEGKTVGFEYLRLEGRGADVFYINSTPGQKELPFRLAEVASMENGAVEFRFANPAVPFPQKLTYRRAAEGWLYASVEGKVNGVERKLIYPMRHVDCESGDLITK